MMVSHRLYQDLRETAEIDFLTNIYNRRAIQQVLTQQFNQFKRYNSICSLILLDIYYFKSVNDNYGHETGDGSGLNLLFLLLGMTGHLEKPIVMG